MDFCRSKFLNFLIARRKLKNRSPAKRPIISPLVCVLKMRSMPSIKLTHVIILIHNLLPFSLIINQREINTLNTVYPARKVGLPNVPPGLPHP